MREVGRYWSAPTANEDAPAPHSTGSALDLTLRWTGGDPLWMGSLFDDASPIAHRDRMETHADPMSFSDTEARANRRLLHWIMSEEGFVGYSEEWWHFSYGDQQCAGRALWQGEGLIRFVYLTVKRNAPSQSLPGGFFSNQAMRARCRS